MTFSEIIKVRDGRFFNVEAHQARMSRTARHFFGRSFELVLPPPEIGVGLVKCRVVYGAGGIESVEFSSYTPRLHATAAIVHDNDIEYGWKSTDRSPLAALVAASGCDDVVIVKNGLVTDSSFANIVLEDAAGAHYTPSTPLLKGTKREMLLRNGTISEREIHPEELLAAARIHLINAMIDLEDGAEIQIR